MTVAHKAGCARGDWLTVQPKRGLFWVVLFREGPACDCGAAGDCSDLNSRDDVTGGAPLAPTGVNSQARGVATG